MSSRASQLIAFLTTVVLALLLSELTGVTTLLASFKRLSLIIPGLARAAPAEPKPAPGSGPPSLSQDFLISLPMGDEERYLRTTVVIEVETTEARDRLKQESAGFREAFISQAVDLPPGDYSGSKGLERSRSMMRSALQKTHPGIKVSGIWFSDFILR